MERPLAVSFVQLQAFSEVVRLGSFTRASQALHLTQAGLSARLLKLEQQLSCQLFVRTSQGAHLTDAGRAFLPYARRALTSIADGARLVGDSRCGGLAQLALAVSPELSGAALSAIVGGVRELLPGVQLQVRTRPAAEARDAVARGEAHLGIVPRVEHDELEAVPLLEEELVLAVAPGHELAGRTGVRLTELAEHPVVLVDRSPGSAEDVVFHAAGLSLAQTIEVDNVEAARHFATAGRGIALLPLGSCADDLLAGALVAVVAADLPAPRLLLAAVRSRTPATAGGLLDPVIAVAAAACRPLGAPGGGDALARSTASRPNRAGAPLAGTLHTL